MQLLQDDHNLHRAGRRECIATIGSFDGLHLGHQAVIARMHTLAAETSSGVTIILFEPLPKEFFMRQNPLLDMARRARLYPLRERLRLLASLKVDQVVCLRFNTQLASMTAQTFIEKILVAGLGIRRLVVGKDFHFGKGREGTVALLCEQGTRFGFGVEVLQTTTESGDRVSSSRIRTALQNGDFVTASRLLGRQFTVSGRVAHGDKRGTALGFPTANILYGRVPPPLCGVYAGTVTVAADTVLRCVINAGWRPTIGGDNYYFEVHIPSFSAELYGHRLRVRPWAKLRDEQCFDSLSALKQQIARDIETANHLSET